MSTKRQQGTLKVWKSDRGFGFIKPDDGSQDVFLHISAVRRAMREPKAGDTIFYKPSLQNDGRIRAVDAAIQGVALQSPKPESALSNFLPSRKLRKAPNRQRPQNLLGVIGGAIVGLTVLTISIAPLFKTSTHNPVESAADKVNSPITAQIDPNCNIKGNISHNSGNRYYHLPGMADYENTIIDLERGERWFCTETEAKASGWQRAPTP
ncbi:MAG: cold shock domain-containing protein [Cyanobacteria bacterium P01_C01_bin.70]